MSNESIQQSRHEEQKAQFTQAHIDIAVLKVGVENLARENARENAAMATEIRTLAAQVAAMNQLLSEARGGWKVVLMAAGAAAAIGSVVSWVIAHMGAVKP